LFAPVLTTQTAGGQTDYLFTYTKPLDRNATYTVEKSGDLTTWTSVPDSVVSTTIDAQVRRAVVPISPGMTTLFLRLKITTP
jgi:hypothetical protein